MSVELQDTSEIEQLWAAFVSGRVSYTTWADLQVALTRPLGSMAEVSGDNATHEDPVSNEIVANDGVYRRVAEGWERIYDLPPATLEATQAVLADVEAVRDEVLDTKIEIDAAADFRVGVARASLAELTALAGPFTEGASAAVYSDGANNGYYSYTAGAWVKITNLPEDSAAASAAAAADSVTDVQNIIDAFEEQQNAVWFVSPAVTGAAAGAGTITNPFSPEHAFTGGSGVIKPGHTIYLRGGIYKASAHGLAGGRWDGFRVGVSGTPDKPIVIQDYPGELAVFDDPLMWTTLTQYGNGGDLVFYESNQIANVAGFWVGGSYRVNGKWYPLVSYRIDAIAGIFQATTSLYNTAGNYYIGPGVVARSNGQIRIRLNDPYIAAQDPFFAGQSYGDTPVQPVSLDPATADIALFRQYQVGVQLDGDYVEWRGTQIDGFYELMRISGDGCKVIDLVSTRCPYVGITPIGSNWVIGGDNFDLDGNLRETGTNLAWGDIKNGNEVAVQNRCQAIPMTNGIGLGRLCGKFTIQNFFDGSVVTRPDIEVGGPVDKTVLDGLTGQALENALWATAGRFLNIWDDAFQIGHQAQRLEIHHIICEGAGPSRDGTGSTIDYGAEFPNIHHCIFNGNATRRMENRRGRNSTRNPPLPEPDAPGAVFGNNNEAGRQNPPAISSHGPNGAADAWLFPWHLSYCTIIPGQDLNVPRFYLNLASFNPTAGKRHGVPNRVSNCLVIDRGLRGGNAFSGNVRYLNLQRITTTVETDIFDGNVFVYAEDAPLRFQLLTTSTGNLDNQITSAAELQAGAILADVQAYYPNGWEAAGLDIQGNLEDVIDPLTYRPRDPAIKAGAIDLTLADLPGLAYYQAQRGALAPLDAL